MDTKELMQMLKLENLKEPIQNSQVSLKSSTLTEQEIDRLLVRYGVPKKFIKYRHPLPLPLKKFVDSVEKGSCLIGGAGTGKTTALVSLMIEWLKRGRIFTDCINSWKFIVYPDFIMRLQDSYKHDKGEQTALETLQDASRTPFLVIDDLGAEKPTEYVRQATYCLINYREMNLLPTFITTNYSMDYVDEKIDSRISSRISGMCEIIRFDGKDKRIGS